MSNFTPGLPLSMYKLVTVMLCGFTDLNLKYNIIGIKYVTVVDYFEDCLLTDKRLAKYVRFALY